MSPRFSNRFVEQDFYGGQSEHVEMLPERPGRYAEPASASARASCRSCWPRAALSGSIQHQVAALELARAGHDLVVVTGTASGKTLCYNLPILETGLDDPEARALYLFPTKALAQDQHKACSKLLAGGRQDARANYCRASSTATRPRPNGGGSRPRPSLVLSNPDMLHASILPYHPKWGRFFSNLRYVVIDEIHTYRGILGANVACVLQAAGADLRTLRLAARRVWPPAPRSPILANWPASCWAATWRWSTATAHREAENIFALWNPAPLGQAIDWLAAAQPTTPSR